METGLEYLSCRSTDLSLEEDGDTLVGRAIVVGSYARIGDHWETISSRALLRPEDEDTVLTLEHNQAGVMARTSSGTLVLRASADGRALEVRANLAKTTTGMDTRELLRRKDVSGMSFAMKKNTIEDEWGIAPDGAALRTIHGFRLVDVSVVSRPAYGGTDAELRSVQFEEAPPATPTRTLREQLIRARAASL